jgi:methyltransferase (TIGR00027 family)
MRAAQPSLTARRAAAHRVAHQVLEHGAVFSDPLVAAMLGEDPAAVAAAACADPAGRSLRLFIAARGRVAEDALAAAVARGARQAVVLGAGLDTLGLRNPHAGAGLRVFEVDHPATQAWKRERLAQAGLEPPGTLTFAPADFEHQELADALRTAGFRADRPAFFVWLGVVPYLTRDAIARTLRTIAAVPGAEVVFDYAEPEDRMAPERRARAAALAERVAAAGEPLVSRLDPVELARELEALGFGEVEDLGPAALAVRCFGRRAEDVRPGGGPHVVRAARTGPS